MRIHLLLLILWLFFSGFVLTLEAQENLIRLEKGSIEFKSDAPLEVIQATSTNLRGVINPDKRSFAFSIAMNSFEGFNSPLQKEHFNENYLESTKYPQATFAGKIIEDVNFEQDGDYSIRAKGKLVIHGIEQERIIKSSLNILNNKIEVRSNFTVLLEDHDIGIPKIVYQKIAEEIQVQIQATFARKQTDYRYSSRLALSSISSSFGRTNALFF